MTIDKRLLVSLHGKRFGLSRAGHIVEDDHVMEPSWMDRGARVKLLDHFTGPVLSTVNWSVAKGSDGSAANFAFNAALGGTARATTGAGVSTMAVNGVQITGSLNWEADQGSLEFGAAVKAAAVTNLHMFVGYTNQVASLQTPGTISGGTLTVVANDFVGFMLDTAATVPTTWKFVSALAGTATTILDTGIAATAAKYDACQIDIDALGNAIGRLYGFAGDWVGETPLALTPTVPLAPLVCGFRRTTSTTTIDVDFISCQVDRSAA